MASKKQKAAARRNIKKAQAARKRKGRKRSSPKRRKGKATRRSRFVKGAKKRYTTSPMKFFTDIVTVGTALTPVLDSAMSANAAGATWREKMEIFGRNVSGKYTGYDYGTQVFNSDWLYQGYGPLAAAIGYNVAQGVVQKAAPVKSILPGRKQGLLSWGSSVAANAISNVAAFKALGAIADDTTATNLYKLRAFQHLMTAHHTGVRLDNTTGAYDGWVPEDMIVGYAPVAGGFVMKKAMQYLNKKVKLNRMPRLS